MKGKDEFSNRLQASVVLLTVEQGHLRLDGGRLHQGAHHHRQVLLKLFTQDFAHPGPGWDHVGDLDQKENMMTVQQR